MSRVQRYSNAKQDELSEEEFLKITSFPNNSSICFIESPGMGKSTLFQQIARKFLKESEEKTTSFLNFRDLIHEVKLCKNLDTALINLIREDEKFLKTKLTSKDNDVLIELLLDGLDEVDTSDSKFALDLLKELGLSFPSIRLWVTSRPHLQEQLENTLNVLAYNIRRFSEHDQITFLTEFWSRSKRKLLDRISLANFAKICLKSIKSSMTEADNDIAGIPLQCLLIAEVYEDDAIGFAQLNNHLSLSTTTNVEVYSIANLYKRMIDRKIQKYKSAYGEVKLNEDDLMEIHFQLSLKLLFPTHLKSLKSFSKSVDMEEILKIGLVVATSTVSEPNFIHRTVAEYLIAEFIWQYISKPDMWNNHGEINSLLWNGVLAQEQVQVCIFPYLALDEPRYHSSYQFKHLPISHFLNSLMSEHPEAFISTGLQSLIDKQTSEITTQQISYSCANSNFIHIFNFVMKIIAFDKNFGQVFDFDFLLLSILKSSLPFIKLAFNLLEKYHGVDAEDKEVALLAAVKKGDFSVVEFLLKEKGMKEVVQNYAVSNQAIRQLLFYCLEDTFELTDDNITIRTEILRVLVNINRSLLEERKKQIDGSLERTPLFAYGIHIKLLLDVIRLGANLNVISFGYTIIHYSTDNSWVSKEYHSLISNIPKDILVNLINVKAGFFHEPPLVSLLRHIDPDIETLKILKEAGADFNSIDRKGNSIIANAIFHGRNAATLRNLIECGANVNFKMGWRRKTLLHFAAEQRNEEALELLLDEYGFEVNRKDWSMKTPLDYVIWSGQSQNLEGAIRVLLERGAKASKLRDKSLLDKLIKDGNTKSLLTIVKATDILNVEESIKLLKYFGCLGRRAFARIRENDLQFVLDKCLNSGTSREWRDEKGNTFLHLAASSLNEPAVRYFVEELRADLNARNNLEETPLYSAAKFIDLSEVAWRIVEFMINNGANVYALDSSGSVFLHEIMTMYHIRPQFQRISEFLVAHNLAKLLEVANKNGETPLKIALNYNVPHFPSLSLLRSNNVGMKPEHFVNSLLNSCDNKMYGERPLLSAASSKAPVDALEFFLGFEELDVNERDTDGNAPLHFAVEKHEPEGSSLAKVKLLLEHGANSNVLNREGLTSLDLAKRSLGKDVIQILEIRQRKMADGRRRSL